MNPSESHERKLDESFNHQSLETALAALTLEGALAIAEKRIEETPLVNWRHSVEEKSKDVPALPPSEIGHYSAGANQAQLMRIGDPFGELGFSIQEREETIIIPTEGGEVSLLSQRSQSRGHLPQSRLTGTSTTFTLSVVRDGQSIGFSHSPLIADLFDKAIARLHDATH